MISDSIRRKPGETQLDFEKVKDGLKKIRNQEYPKQPKVEHDDGPEKIQEKYQELLDQKYIRESFGKTLDKRHKLYFGSVVKALFAFHVFVSFAAIDFIKKHISKEQQQKRRYLIDGTFKVVPRKFNQLLIIAIEYQNDVRMIFYLFLKFYKYSKIDSNFEQNTQMKKHASFSFILIERNDFIRNMDSQIMR